MEVCLGNLRKHGEAPFTVVVIHGGPGAAGEMAPVARELAAERGVLEPMQTATSLEGQVEELRVVLEQNGDLPVTLIGFSWGAWLSFIFAAKHPDFVKKLILVGSGPYEEKYASGIQDTRLDRLTDKEKAELESVLRILDNPASEDRTAAFARFGALFSKADAYAPLEDESEAIDYQVDVFQSVWRDAAELRRSGKLLALGRLVRCPVVAIHGAYDPHPAEGVEKPLSAILPSFGFFLLKNCGHRPWIERQARKRFFDILRTEI
ncbi:MAG TPA: alpha/beta hydrolase [Acidobacteriota bacterium]|nr:alpha/beta hydrolase [Acidobacteriota bacterium]